MSYYYLDGLDKKGPYTVAEIKSRNLKNETLVYTEGMGSWKPLKDFPELYISPEEDKAVDQRKEIIAKTTATEQVPTGQIISPKKTNIKIPSFLLVIVFLLIFVGISYGIVSYLKQRDFAKINAQIDNIFNGKTSISDYRKLGNNGILYPVTQVPLFEGTGGEDVIVKTKNATLAIKPTPPNFGEDLNYQNRLKKWNEFKDLVQYYECGLSSGFTTLHITKDGADFTLEESWSGDMAYKVPESIYHPGRDLGYGVVTDSYTTPTFRPEIFSCYEAAAKYLTVENEDKSYEGGSYEKVDNFKYLSTRFYKIEAIGTKYSHVGNDAYFTSSAGSFNKIIRDSRITDATSADDAAVFTSQWIVWYRTISNNYRLVEDTKAFNKFWEIYSIFGAVLSFLIVVILKYRKKVTLQV